MSYNPKTIFDAHAHIHFPAYDKDRDEVIKRAQLARVKMIAVGTNLATSQGAIDIAEKYPNDIWATVGVHPTEIDTSTPLSIQIKNLRILAQHPKVVAIGECGLDYFRISNDEFRVKEEQKKVFLEQIKLAQELSKPLMIHCRPSKGTDDAYEDLLDQFSLSTDGFKLSIIVHFFVGSTEIAKKLLDLGCLFTFGGVITFTRDYDEVIKFLPLENILLETDAPYVAPEPYRGKRNEPAYVIEVAKKIAGIQGISYNRVVVQTTNNIYRVGLTLTRVF